MGPNHLCPVYSHIYYGDQHFQFSYAQYFRNTDVTNSIIITSVRYYNSDGKLVKQYLERPIQLGALASTDFL